MQATDVVAVVASVCVAVLVGAFVMLLATLARTLRELRTAVEEFTDVAVPLVVELRDTVSEASVELDRVERLVTSAETVTDTIDSASRLAYRTLASPVVKAMALRAGVTRASKRLRGDGGHDGHGADDDAHRPGPVAESALVLRSASSRDGQGRRAARRSRRRGGR